MCEKNNPLAANKEGLKMTMYFILDNLRSRLQRHITFALHQCQWWWLHTLWWQESYFIVTLTFRVLLMRHCSGSEDASLCEISTCVSICCHFFQRLSFISNGEKVQESFWAHMCFVVIFHKQLCCCLGKLTIEFCARCSRVVPITHFSNCSSF